MDLPIVLTFDEVAEALKQAWKEGRVAVQNQEAIDSTDCLYWYPWVSEKRVGCVIGVAFPDELLEHLAGVNMLGSPISTLVKCEKVVVDDLEKFKQLQQCHDLAVDSMYDPPDALFKRCLAGSFPEIVLEEV